MTNRPDLAESGAGHVAAPAIFWNRSMDVPLFISIFEVDAQRSARLGTAMQVARWQIASQSPSSVIQIVWRTPRHPRSTQHMAPRSPGGSG
ncbi:hypothetical protein C7I55_11505 [Sphingomonas deserti]|uniref:Uncharacterized protein n=1 Tax=Allosphingosinicella deserti TaxID=2116704 RepID=A0A2P7QSF6_9SPHN|nr:hypothetical protein C7I55_11505 [Sphingomonas deserti]